MLLTKANYDLANAFVTGTNITAVGQKVLNASVKLQGTAGKDQFTGSATILGVGKEVSYVNSTGKWTPTTTRFTVIVTAKHSLYIQGNAGKLPDTAGTPKWDQSLADGFKNVQIYYSNSGTNTFGTDPGKTAAIDHVVPIFEENIGTALKMIAIPDSASSDGTAFMLLNLAGTTTPDGSGSISGKGSLTPAADATSWAYDVMILLSKDADLYTFASTAGNCDFQANATQEQLNAALAAYYGRSNNFQGLVPVLSRTQIQIVQTGFGKTSEQLLPKGGKDGDDKITLPTPTKPATSAGAVYGRLQYKLATPTEALETNPFYSETPADSGTIIVADSHGFLLDCAGGNNSTDSGDSGGGVFAFKKTPTAPVTNAALIGVNTGSAVAAARGEAAGMWDFENNVVTSLGPYYAGLFNLRFQNV